MFSIYPCWFLSFVGGGEGLKHRHHINFAHAFSSTISEKYEKQLTVCIFLHITLLPYFEHVPFVLQLYAVFISWMQTGLNIPAFFTKRNHLWHTKSVLWSFFVCLSFIMLLNISMGFNNLFFLSFQRKNYLYSLSSNVSFEVKSMPYKVQPAKLPEGSIAVSNWKLCLCVKHMYLVTLITAMKVLIDENIETGLSCVSSVNSWSNT